MKKLLVFCLVMICISNVWACLNGEQLELSTGKPLYMDHGGSVPYGHIFISKAYLLNEIKVLDSVYKRTKNLDYLTDKGLVMIIAGEYQKAIDLYLQIEKIKPGRYSTASNIGTAYELTGNNEQALKWISRAITINPASHKNSEWIHVNILKLKINKKIAVSALSLIGIDFGQEERPRSILSKPELEKLADALFYQLNERMSFIKPKDQIIAQLLFEYANINMLLGDNTTAHDCYEQAQEYGLNEKLVGIRYHLTLDRIKELDSIIIHSEMVRQGYDDMGIPVVEQKSNWTNPVWMGSLVFAVVLTGTFFYNRKRKKASR
jgi:tetratricopeptide (TPR) repeat protein